MVHWPMIGSWVLFGQGFCRGWGQDPWTIQPDSRESTANASFRTVRGALAGIHFQGVAAKRRADRVALHHHVTVVTGYCDRGHVGSEAMRQSQGQQDDCSRQRNVVEVEGFHCAYGTKNIADYIAILPRGNSLLKLKTAGWLKDAPGLPEARREGSGRAVLRMQLSRVSPLPAGKRVAWITASGVVWEEEQIGTDKVKGTSNDRRRTNDTPQSPPAALWGPGSGASVLARSSVAFALSRSLELAFQAPGFLLDRRRNSVPGHVHVSEADAQ